MSLDQIQSEVSRLSQTDRGKLVAWMLATYPPRSVDDLVARAEGQARRGQWTPKPPDADNIPKGADLHAAVRRAKAAGVIR